MTRHGEPDDPDRPDDDLDQVVSAPDADEPDLVETDRDGADAPPTAAEIKAAFTATSPGWVYLESLAADEWAWLKRMVRSVAGRYNVDHEDLLQELQLRLRHCHVLDQGRSAVRSWLTQRAKWMALTMLRTGRRRPDTFPLDDVSPDPPAPQEVGLDLDWTVERLRALGLSRDQAQNVLLLAWDIDISMQDYATAIERTYAKVRKDRSRALGKIKDLFDLTDDEEAALVAYRRFGSTAAAAIRLNRPVETVRRLVADAEQKIDRALGRPSAVEPSTGEEDATDVH
ncbi:sigma factor [Pseudonocardia sp.]|uniref:sigma factor n=1 Tax=Pseudonocardia sp. TaxID=60912 RepID=UPI0026235303|nr:sigma factor [Pseudonocardia sp.]